MNTAAIYLLDADTILFDIMKLFPLLFFVVCIIIVIKSTYDLNTNERNNSNKPSGGKSDKMDNLAEKNGKADPSYTQYHTNIENRVQPKKVDYTAPYTTNENSVPQKSESTSKLFTPQDFIKEDTTSIPENKPEVKKELLYSEHEIRKARQDRINRVNAKRQAAQNSAPQTEPKPENKLPVKKGDNKKPWGAVIALSVMCFFASLCAAALQPEFAPAVLGAAVVLSGIILEAIHKGGNRVYPNYTLIMGVLYIAVGMVYRTRNIDGYGGICAAAAMMGLFFTGAILIAKPIEYGARMVKCSESVIAKVNNVTRHVHRVEEQYSGRKLDYYTYSMSIMYEYDGYRYITGYPGEFDKEPVRDARIGIFVNPRYPSEIYYNGEESEHSLSLVLPSIIVGIISVAVMMTVYN